MEASDSRCTHLVIEDSVTDLPGGLVEQSRCQVVRQEVCTFVDKNLSYTYCNTHHNQSG